MPVRGLARDAGVWHARLPMPPPLRLTRAIEAHLPFVSATERLEGDDALVGRWDELAMSVLRPDWEHARPARRQRMRVEPR